MQEPLLAGLGSNPERSLNKGKKPNPDGARVLAFRVLTQVNREGAYANLRLPQALTDSKLEARERAWVTELVYGTLRMQGRHDYAISQIIDRPFAELDEGIVDVLRLGLHQLNEMFTPDHAAVGETVELARAVLGDSKATFVNAILRSILRDPNIFQKLDADLALSILQKLSIKRSHPEWIVKSLYDQVNDWDRVEALLIANNTPVAPHIVAWPGKSTVAEFLELGAERIVNTHYGVRAHQPVNSYPAIHERRAGVQDLGSQLVSEIFLNTASGHTENLHWLDLCAGPGGKASFLYNDLRVNRPKDSFTANEPTPHRAELISHVIPRDNVIIHRGEELVTLPNRYDRILIDAPCTGLGALRRRPEARWRRSLSDLKSLVEIQRKLFDAGIELLNPGGILAFVTCSPHLAETKSQVFDALYRHKKLNKIELVDIEQYFPERLPDHHMLTSEKTMQLWTDIDGSDSMFMALFRKI